MEYKPQNNQKDTLIKLPDGRVINTSMSNLQSNVEAEEKEETKNQFDNMKG